MAERLNRWRGLFTDVGPLDVPAGAMVQQNNIGVFQAGTLSVRKGIVPLSFTGYTPSGSADGISIVSLPRPNTNWLVYHKNDGGVKAIRDGGELTIKSGQNVFQPFCFMRDQFGYLLAFNGIDRPWRWDGMTATAENAGMPEPTAAPTFAAGGTGNSEVGDYVAGYRFLDRNDVPGNLSLLAEDTAAANEAFDYTGLQNPADSRVNRVQIFRSTVDQEDVVYLVATLGQNGAITSSANDGGTVRFTVPAGHNLQAGAVVTVAGHSVGGYNTSHEVTAVTGTTIDTDVAYSADGTGGTWVLTGYVDDDLSDDDLTEDSADALPIFYDNGDLLARRFTAPPNYKPFAALFQNRAFYYGNVTYTAGTIAVSGTTVTGTGTAFTAQMVGRELYINGQTKGYTIASWSSGTSIALTETPGTISAGTAYAIRTVATEQRMVRWSEQNEPESVPVENALPLLPSDQDDGEETGLMVYGGFLWLLHERRMYRLSYVSQPAIDADVHPTPDQRGCVNNRCWVTTDTSCYLLDQFGVYEFTGAAKPISAPIQNYFRDNTIDWSKKKWFHAEYEANEKMVRFYVAFTGDSGTLPMNALCYHVEGGEWHIENYIWEMGDSCRATLSGVTRTLIAGEDDRVYKIADGLADWVSTAVVGTATSATGTTLTDSAAPFTSAMAGAPVVITSGTGRGQVRRITSATTTELTVATWTTTPDTTSKYAVGGIPWSAKTGNLQLETSGIARNKKAWVQYNPTVNAALMLVSQYPDFRATAEPFRQNWQTGAGVLFGDGDNSALVDMKATQFASGHDPGIKEVALLDGPTTHGLSQRWMAMGFGGVQSLDRILFYAADITGVQ